jgi:membrane-associated phospholipid phosphatase
MGIAGELLTTVETIGLGLVRPSHRSSRRAAEIASTVSKGGGLWVGLTVVCQASPATRRAGREGLAAWATASAAAFGVKRVTDRRRPRFVRAIGPGTRSSSMPSSHTAGAVAYATAASLALPLAGLVVAPAAAAIAWSRTASARHFPTDVAAGAALGLAAGVAVHQLVRPRAASAVAGRLRDGADEVADLGIRERPGDVGLADDAH